MNRRIKPMCAALLLLLGLAGQAGAQSAGTAAAAPATRVAAEPARVDATFRAWDADRNGVLSLEEFRQGYAKVATGVRQARLRAQFEAVDANDDGGIDAGEYAAMALVRRAGAAAPALAASDTNKNGRLEFAEYRALVRRLATQAQRKPSQGKPK